MGGWAKKIGRIPNLGVNGSKSQEHPRQQRRYWGQRGLEWELDDRGWSHWASLTLTRQAVLGSVRAAVFLRMWPIFRAEIYFFPFKLFTSVPGL